MIKYRQIAQSDNIIFLKNVYPVPIIAPFAMDQMVAVAVNV